MAIYEPFIRRTLAGMNVGDEDDVTGEALAAVVQSLPEFTRQRTGSFRAWVREIVRRRVQAHVRDRKKWPTDSDALAKLEQLADNSSEVSGQWDRDHDRYVLSQSLAIARAEFGERVFAAFEGTAVNGRPAGEVAVEQGMTPTAVYVARHRVLARIRGIVADITGDGVAPSISPEAQAP